MQLRKPYQRSYAARMCLLFLINVHHPVQCVFLDPREKESSPLANKVTFNNSLQLTADQYYPSENVKDLITLHNTVSLNAKGSFNWWQTDPGMVGTSLLLDRDGTLFNVFPLKAWAWGMRAGERNERRAVQVEIVNTGPLKRVGNVLHWMPDMTHTHPLYDMEKDADKYVKLAAPWRGYEYWQAYTEAQIVTVCALVNFLCDTIPTIPRVMLGVGDELKVLTWSQMNTVKGIISHHNVPDVGKMDVGPHFPFARLRAALASPASIQARS